MADEVLLSMDEGALRKLLEATLDLAERRQIRSAIRELRRQELERDEEALASKRFRAERGSSRQENKENLLRSRQLEEEERQQKSLDILSRKLEGIQDVEELTVLLRAASEYEERKLIRAAIRKLRAEEIEAAALAGKVFYSRRGTSESLETQRSKEKPADQGISEAQELAERELIRAQIRELRSQEHQEPKATEEPDSSLGTFLLLGPVSLSLPPPGPSSFPEGGPDPESSTEDRTSGSHDSESSTGSLPPFQEEKVDVTSAAEDGEGQRARKGVDAGDTMEGDPDASDAGSGTCLAEEPPQSLPSEESKPGEDVPPAPEEDGSAADEEREEPPPAVPKAPATSDGPLHDTSPPTRQPAASTEPRQQQPFQRTGSVLERARKFGFEPPKPVGAVRTPQKAESANRGARVLQQQQQQPPQPHPQCKADLPVAARGGVGHALPRTGRPYAVGTDPGVEQAARCSTFQAPTGTVRPPVPGPTTPKEAGASRGRSQGSQWQGSKLTPAPHPIENATGSSSGSEKTSVQRSTSSSSPLPSRARNASTDPSDAMKTLFTIEIKEGRSQPIRSHVVGTPGNQRAELTLGLRSSPIRITTSSSAISASHGGSGSRSQMEAEVPEQPRTIETVLSNGTEKGRAQAPETQQRSRLSAEELSKIEEEDVLDRMLDQTSDFEERRLIRTAMRELRQRKREQREKDRNQKLQESKTTGGTRTMETTARQSTTSADGSAVSTVTKTQRLVHSNDGSKTSRTMTVESSYVKKSETDGNTFVQTKSAYSSSSSKKVGSIFEREDESPSRASSLAALERRQAEKKKELMKAQSLPKTSASQARKAMIEKLEKESGSPANPAMARVAIQRSASFGVPNANSIKQMLLDWCRAKTRGYEHVDIQNFSSSWSDGMAFCALVHNFFPEAFDYAQLSPQDRRRNFEMAFSAAETHAECPQLLDVEDMVRMREPDWKCVYTYIQEFYRCLVQKGLVKTKKS